MRSVHPHLRGAYFLFVLIESKVSGSSPHTWGIRRARQAYIDQRRFIPTYVGHTRCAKRRWPGGPVHPHIRGAYISPRHSAERLSGSSPHTWGIRRYDAPDQQARRFIPTYVGHTCATSRNLRNTSVHPHIRGAYEGFTLLNCVDFGSSPHTWGIRMRPVGSVPAPPGSSPHTWGIHPISRGLSSAPRFIPTYVGHTPFFFNNVGDIPVHPHIRGAYRKHDLFHAGRSGFIPTYVGHTCQSALARDSGSVHPHIRGAYGLSTNSRPVWTVHPHIRGAYSNRPCRKPA